MQISFKIPEHAIYFVIDEINVPFPRNIVCYMRAEIFVR